MHHTKEKGDQGLAFVIADLVSSGIQVALPLSEHQPWDCIAVTSSGRMAKLQVKYARASINHDKIEVHISSSWADKNGCHHKPRADNDYDVLAIYCPTTKDCYYIPTKGLECRRSVTLRLTITHKKQKNMRFAQDYRSLLNAI